MSLYFREYNFLRAVSTMWFRPGDHFPIVRRKHFTLNEIFAFTGGLLGLFLGISVVSFAEVAILLLDPWFKKLSTKATCWKQSPCFNRQNNRFFKTFYKVKPYVGFYLKESSIHSFNFIAEASNCFEVIFWILSFILSMSGCAFMILQLYLTMNFKAVSYVMEDLMDVSRIPFPAVTIFGRFPEELLADRGNMTEYETVKHGASRYDRGTKLCKGVYEFFTLPTMRSTLSKR